jgi:HSP20 family protein
VRIRLRSVESVHHDIEEMQRQIAARAGELCRDRGGEFGHALDDWLTAERETVWRPALEVQRTNGAFVVEAAIAGVDPKRLDVRVTPKELLVTANVHHSDREQEGKVLLCEFVGGPLFRTYAFPEPVDPARASAEYRHGLLRVTAPLARSVGGQRRRTRGASLASSPPETSVTRGAPW